MNESDMTQQPSRRIFSADVDLQLAVNGHVFSLTQIGPDDVIVQEPVDMPPCDAEVIMSIDGKERRWAVSLVDGMSSSDKHVKTVDIHEN